MRSICRILYLHFYRIVVLYYDHRYAAWKSGLYALIILSPFKTINSILSALYPPRCLCCGVPTGSEEPLCEDCAKSWRAERLSCQCGQDGNTLYLAVYTKGRSVARTLVLHAKHSNERRLYKFLADELSELLSAHCGDADYIINVPRSPSSVRKTGVDQAELLARALSFSSGVPYLPALRHKSFTKAQKTLGAEARAKNAASAYKLARCANKLPGKTVILLDDVTTTGATLASCGELLLKAGASRVIKAAVTSAK